MLRLSEPKYSFEDAIDSCGLGITGNIDFLSRLNFSKANLLNAENIYLQAGQFGMLCSIPPIPVSPIADPVVVQNLTKTDLVKLYDRYLVDKNKPARAIYEHLLNSAKEKCPFCGGIGTPRNLDHFLPKAHFPQYSVLPKNLIPSCRDCNMDGKGHSFAKTTEEQIVHPYLENDRFFNEQWIFAKYHKAGYGDPGEFEYFAQPPGAWAEPDKQKVKRHFIDFSLARRYATKAAEAIGTTIEQISTMERQGLDVDTIKSVLLMPAVDFAPFVNHWQKGMYQALIGNGW